MEATSFVEKIVAAVEAAWQRREVCTVVAVVFGPSDAERVALWCQGALARRGEVYLLDMPRAFDAGAVRVRVLWRGELARIQIPKGSVVLVDAMVRMHEEYTEARDLDKDKRAEAGGPA